MYAVLGLLSGGAGAWFMSRYAFKFGLSDLPNSRSSHANPTPRGGGVGLLLAFGAASLWSAAEVLFWGPILLLALISFCDDISPLSSRLRLILQLLLALVLVAFTSGPFSAWSLLLIPFWVLFVTGTTNFYNFMDGINGIAGLTGVACFGLISIFARMQTGIPDPVAVALMSACFGFLPFNVPRARVFMGDVGSVLLGFSFAALVFRYANDLASFLCLASFLFLFYADALTTLYLRLLSGEKLTQAHRRHLYQILSNEGSIPHWQVSLGYFLIQLLVGAMMLLAWQSGLLWQAVLLVAFGMVFVYAGRTIRQRIPAKL